MNILEKIKDAFSDKSLPEEKVTSEQFQQRIPHGDKTFSNITTEIVAVSDCPFLVSTAARITIGKDAIDNYEDRISHIGRVIGMGHESILEHTNVIMIIHIPIKYINSDFTEFLSGLHYLHFKQTVTTDNVLHLLIGGSIRGYKHMIKTIKDVTHNKFATEIINQLYISTESVFYMDLVNDGIMDLNKFGFIDHTYENYKSNPHKTLKNEVITLFLSEHHTINYIFEKVNSYGFSFDDLFDFTTVSVIFENISRPISMQIIRHRNAITQESQRYVDYSDKAFIDPNKFIGKQDVKYKVSLFGANAELTSNKLGNKLCSIYKQLLDQGMQKQNARSFLPSNVCTRLMMTFTYRNLMKFFDLRDAKSAQMEVQEVARALKKVFFESYEPNIDKGWIKDALLPTYTIEKIKFDEINNNIDEVLEEEVLEETK